MLKRRRLIASGLEHRQGSRTGTGRSVGEFALKTSCSPKMGQILTRIVNTVNAKEVLELGTGIGISALYIASSRADVHVTSVGEHGGRHDITSYLEKQLDLRNIDLRLSRFETGLSSLLDEQKTFDMAYLDGGHHSEALIRHAQLAFKLLDNGGLLILKDIRWSVEKEKDWDRLWLDPDWGIGLDFYNFGMLIKGRPARDLIRYKLVPYYIKPWRAGFFTSS
jgi:hypothetical protein